MPNSQFSRSVSLHIPASAARGIPVIHPQKIGFTASRTPCMPIPVYPTALYILSDKFETSDRESPVVLIAIQEITSAIQ